MKPYTTVEDSIELVEAGLDPKTADMHYLDFGEKEYRCIPSPFNNVSEQVKPWTVPCWSLSALLNLLESNHIHYNLMYRSYDTELHIYRYKSPDSYEYSEWFEEPINAILWLLENKYL